MTNTTATNKMTNKLALSYVIENFGSECPAEVLEKLENILAQHEKRSSAERKPTARQVENDSLKEQILETMEKNTLYSVPQMVKEFTFFPTDITPQRVSALMTQLAEANLVIREVDKRKVYFRLA